MHYIVESEKSFYEASVDLEEVILRLGCVVLHADDLGAGLLARGGEGFDDECKVFSIVSHRLVESLLAIDVRAGLALPFRITVFTEDGVTRLGLLRPTALLAAVAPKAGQAAVAREIEEKLRQIVDEAR